MSNGYCIKKNYNAYVGNMIWYHPVNIQNEYRTSQSRWKTAFHNAGHSNIFHIYIYIGVTFNINMNVENVRMTYTVKYMIIDAWSFLLSKIYGYQMPLIPAHHNFFCSFSMSENYDQWNPKIFKENKRKDANVRLNWKAKCWYRVSSVPLTVSFEWRFLD